MSDDLRPHIEQVVRDYHQAVYGYAYRLCGTRSDAEDLTQQTFLVAHQKFGQLRQRESLKSWLFTILRNLFLKSLRRRKPQMWDQERLDEQEAPSPVDAGPIDPEDLQQALAELPDLHRLVIVMFYYEGLSYREIAERLDVAIGTVMSRLARAKQSLRARLADPALDADARARASRVDVPSSSPTE